MSNQKDLDLVLLPPPGVVTRCLGASESRMACTL